MLEEILSSWVGVTLALLVVGFVLYQLFRPSGLPDLPIVGAKPGEWFPLVRAGWRNVTDMKTALELAYSKYRNQACIVPVAGAENFVLLPVEEFQWLIDQPDEELLTNIEEALQIKHTFTDPRLFQNPLHQKLISTTLTREVGNLIPDLLDEMRLIVDETWGTDTENFREICLYDAMQHIACRVANRVFVGLPMCRDANLRDTGLAFVADVPMEAMILRFIWKPLRPLVAPLLTLPSRLHTRRFCNLIRPEVEKRLREYEEAPVGGEKKPRHDFLQWSVDQAMAMSDPYYSKCDTLAGRVLLLNFGATHSSSFTMTHVLLDLACSDPKYQDELRTEVNSTLAAHGWSVNKRALSRMEKLDSTLRESQRLNTFVTVTPDRLVVKRGGIETPSGVRVPQGAVVCAPAYAVLHDPAIYPEPETFKPFRFAEKRSEIERENQNGSATGDCNGEKENEFSSSYVRRARQAFTATSPEYTVFGHGRHSCPGRFFATGELKLMLAYIVTHYDFERQGPRPENPWFGTIRTPPLTATIRVRRRKEPLFGGCVGDLPE